MVTTFREAWSRHMEGIPDAVMTERAEAAASDTCFGPLCSSSNRRLAKAECNESCAE